MPVHIDRHSNVTQTTGRVPATLQNVFLASNRGLDVDIPPPLRVANKVFQRSLLGRTYSSDSTDTRSDRRDKGGNLRGIKLRFWIKEASCEPSSVDDANQADGPVAGTSKDDVQPSGEVNQRRKSSSFVPSLSPQQYLDAMAGARGYSIQTNPSLKSPLYTRPTPLQLASYGTYVVALVRNGDDSGLKTALSCGLSSNPCNAFGESLLHMICRRGNIKLFNIILHAGCNVQIFDDNGRSPLHYACWATQPNFDIVERLIERDVDLFYMADSRGSLPLAYTRKEHWSAWLEFLESKKNLFWPREGSGAAQPAGGDDRARTDPCHLPLTIELASMVASGRIAPTEAQLLLSTQHADAEVDADADDDSDDDRDDSVADDETVSSDGNSSRPVSHSNRWPATRTACFQHDEILNENEMNDILQSLLSSERRPLKW